MPEAALRAAICEAGRRLYQRNLVAATDGNLSVRLLDGTFLCTPSGVSKGFMQPEDLVVVDAQGQRLRGTGKVTSEFFTHLAAYVARPEIAAVVHAHPPAATALTLAGVDLCVPLLPDAIMAFGGIPTAPYATPGTREGAEAIRDLIGQCDAVLLDRHGAVTVGASVMEAYFKMEKLEHVAQTIALARAITPLTPLDDDAVARAMDARRDYGAKGKAFPMATSADR